jgi:hypothetical protein
MQEQVRMTLNEAGRKRGTRQIDGSRTRRRTYIRGGTDCRYAVALNEHDPSGVHIGARAIEDAGRSDEDGRGLLAGSG